MKKNKFKKFMYESAELSQELKDLLEEGGEAFFEYGKKNCRFCHGNGYNEVDVIGKGFQKLPCDCAIRRKVRKTKFTHNYPVWAVVKNGVREFVYTKSKLPNYVPSEGESL